MDLELMKLESQAAARDSAELFAIGLANPVILSASGRGAVTMPQGLAERKPSHFSFLC
jgi:hypothetical protein